MVHTPENDFTRMIERTARMNEQMSGGAASASPRPTAASAALGREVETQAPLSAEERRELDLKAVELGLLPPEAIGLTTVGEGEYATQEEALAAAGIDINAMTEPPIPTVDPTLVPRRNVRTIGRPAPVVQTKVVEMPRLPDFSKVQGLDLVAGEAFLDGMSFKVPPAALRKMRKYVVELAHSEMTSKLNDAMALFAEGATDGNDGGGA